MARFLGSLESMGRGKLTAGEVKKLRDTFNTMYFDNLKAKVDQTGYKAAEDWYRVEMEVTAAVLGDKTAVARIFRILGIEGTPQ